MTLMDHPLFVRARGVLERLERAGYQAYFVGGSIRDWLLGKEISDLDIATSATPSQVKELFDKTVDIGIEHGTVMVLAFGGQYEVTTFRTEGDYLDSRHPSHVSFVTSLKEDLQRRDFTINALALGLDGQVRDYFQGMEDLHAGIIRCVGQAQDRFDEDALRMMRAVRFVGQLGFQMEEETQKAITLMGHKLNQIAVERIKVEMEKLWSSPHRKAGIGILIETGLYKYCPGLSNSQSSLEYLAEFPLNQLSPVQAWILLAKAEGMTPDQAQAFLRLWKASRDLIQAVEAGLSLWNDLEQDNLSHTLLYPYSHDLSRQVVTLAFPQDCQRRLGQVDDLFATMPIHSLKDLAINGGQVIGLLGLDKPGPQVGQVLDYLAQEVLSGRLANEGPSLRQAVLKEKEKM